MSELTSAQIIDPEALDASERDALTEELYAAHSEIFAGVDRDAFVAYVIRSPAKRTRSQFYRSGTGEVVGYTAVHTFQRRLQGKEIWRVRAEAGLKREWRGSTSAGLLLIQ